ncbi:MAG: cyclase family protein [Saprospiraceae bacterium]|nr:cyclase family protein [Saprospiraceae bacterium]
MAYIDLSHTIENGTLTYRGLPAPVICDYLSREESRKLYAPGTEFQIARIDMVANTGTYLDCPFHRYEHGKDLADYGLERFAGLPAVVVRVDYRKTRSIDASFFRPEDYRGKAVLVQTNWSEHWGTDAYFEHNPFLTEDAAELLANSGAMLVGIDSHNIDDTSGNTRPVHTVLLGRDILIVEHLCNLHLLPDDGFLFSAVPPKFRGVGTFPVRAFATI